MSYTVEPQDPSVERLARLMEDRFKAKNAARRLQTLTATLDDLELAAVAEVSKAMGDPFGLAILQLLRDGELCACEIMTALDRSQSSTSHHLPTLKRAGLVKERKVGKWSRYRLSEGAVIEVTKLADLMMGDGWLPKKLSGSRHI